MSKLDDLPERILEIAAQVGDSVRDRVPDQAVKWVETGAALGALKAGSKVATRFVRRNPVIVVAAAAGAGLLWYAAHRRARQAREAPIEGRSRRIEARRTAADEVPAGESRRTRRAGTGKPRSPR